MLGHQHSFILILHLSDSSAPVITPLICHKVKRPKSPDEEPRVAESDAKHILCATEPTRNNGPCTCPVENSGVFEASVLCLRLRLVWSSTQWEHQAIPSWNVTQPQNLATTFLHH
ncbi:hypothetical protein BDW42DRAFT_127264 [Aspergillus taichungensis]|uniref:Uncharacterized protein n=1 Tax=Aspergillus taichungensis TaxID=482145 RepID=A0A2J5HQ00_9EURO|nr:hypothetical protein BDW42DRAFT_127264 [Aspergillus taichungensis]